MKLFSNNEYIECYVDFILCLSRPGEYPMTAELVIKLNKMKVVLLLKIFGVRTSYQLCNILSIMRISIPIVIV